MDAGVVSGLLQSVMQDDSRRRRLRSLKGGASKRPSTRRVRRRGAVCGVAALGRVDGIACVASPCIRPRGARLPTTEPTTKQDPRREATRAQRPRSRRPPEVGNAGFAGVYPPHPLFSSLLKFRVLTIATLALWLTYAAAVAGS